MKNLFFLWLLAALCYFFLNGNMAIAQDIIYPAGKNIKVLRQLDKDIIRAADTIIITRIFVNKETRDIRGLFLSEYWPGSFTEKVIQKTATRNGQTITLGHQIEYNSSAGEIYDTHHWIFDSPHSWENISNPIRPGDSLHLTIKITPGQMGLVTLPEPTASFLIESSGSFSIGTANFLNILYRCGDINGNGDVNLLDVSSLALYLYRQGEPPVPIEAGDINGDEKINLFDITSLIEFLYRGGPPPVCENP